MLSNAEMAGRLELLAKLLEMYGENSFKVKNYAFNASILKKLPTPLLNKSIVEQQAQLGAAVKNVIIELVETGKIASLETLMAKTPEGVLDLLKIKGLGPKKVAMLWNEHGILSVEDLESACLENRLITLKGFGIKTQQQLLDQIAFIKNTDGWCLWIDGEKWKNAIDHWFENTYRESQHLLSFVGDFAMQLPVINGLECLTTIPIDELEQALLQSFGETYTYENDGLSLVIINENHASLTFMYQSKPDFYTKAFMHSSSQAFLDVLTQKYDLPGHATSEKEIFDKIGLPYIPPYLRHDDTVLNDVLAHKTLPVVIQQADIKGLIHCHSTWSDGLNTIAEMAQMAIVQGLEYMVISDHSKTAAYANGLSVESVKKQHAEIDILNEQLAPFKIFKGIESDILGDGSLDYPDEVLASFDVVIASIHSNLNMDKEKATARIMTAIQNPYTSILGHPTGRLLLARKGYELDMAQIIDACSIHDVIIELNANPKRLDVDWIYLKNMIAAGVRTAINPDAHSIAQIELTKYGVLVAQQAALVPGNNLSSYNLAAMEAFVAAQKAKRP